MSRAGRAVLALTWLRLGAGCSGDCCVIDSYPVPLERAPLDDDPAAPGALLVAAVRPETGPAPVRMVLDTGFPIAVMNAGDGSGDLQTTPRSFDLVDEGAPPNLDGALPVRARFSAVDTLDLPLAPVGGGGVPGGVLGGNLLRAFSVAFRFSGPCLPGQPTLNGRCASVTFWRHLGADAGFLQDAGYAVLRFALAGGGEVSASGDPDVFGTRGPLELPATRVVLRACGAPRPFAPTEARETCCTRDDANTRATGVDLALVVATGVGPLVLSQSAWARVQAAVAAQPGAAPLPPAVDGTLAVATWPVPIQAGWTSLPRLALVDLEAGNNADPGPCVELGRSRRIEWTEYQQAMAPAEATSAPCVQVCDTDQREPNLAQNSAGYIELGGSIPVAVVSDTEMFLDALRSDIRPEGPIVDGVLGAAALDQARVEIDYLSSTPRAVFSCEPLVPRETCWTAARCPRLPDNQQSRSCFGLPSHRLPATCAPSGC